jgi:hypothetical protein
MIEMPLAAARVEYDSKIKTLSPNGGGSLTHFPGNQPGEAAVHLGERLPGLRPVTPGAAPSAMCPPGKTSTLI